MNDNTRDAAVRFIETQPDWSASVRYWVRHSTNLVRSRNGTEQRTAHRTEALYQLAYLHTLLAEEWPVRRLAAMLELSAAVVVPIWVRQDNYASALGNVVTLDEPTARSPYKVGGYAYFVEAGKTSVFRVIEAIGSYTLTLVSGNAAYPVVAVPSYTSAAVVYPCIRGWRKDNTEEWQHAHVDEVSETIDVEEL